MLANTLSLESLWSSARLWLASVAIGTLLLISLTIIYRLTLHPLAKYPGPFLAKITDLDNLYHAWKWDRHRNFLRCHEKYGPIYRYGPDRLSFNTVASIQDIYGPKANVQKASYYEAFAPGSSFSLIDKARHNRKRKAVAHAFSDRALKSMDEYVLENIRRWCEAFKKAAIANEALDMTHHATYLTFDIMGELGFGKSMNMIGGENRYISDFIMTVSTFANILGSVPRIVRKGIMGLFLPESKQKSSAFAQFVNKMAGDRIAMEGEVNRRDVFHYLLEAKFPETGEGFTLHEMRGEAVTFIIAGSETTATTIAGMFFYLGNYPRVLERAKKEVRDVFEGDDVEDIRTGPKLSSCAYLRACIEETLRITPPIPGALPRQVCHGGATIDGESIPAGIDVSVAAYALHHTSENYPAPWSFKPERWMLKDESNEDSIGSSKVEVELAQSAFMSFSIGPRSCTGKNLAYTEIVLAMARVLFLFDFHLVGNLGEDIDHKEVFYLGDHFSAYKEGPRVKFVKRTKVLAEAW